MRSSVCCWAAALAFAAGCAANPASPAGEDAGSCVPVGCAEGACGEALDGCGGTVTCGDCPAGQACGAGGVENVCGEGTCTPTTCAAKGKNCGSLSDGCGRLLSCGACPSGQRCGAGGVANVCAEDSCTSTSCQAQGKNCGEIPDGCGGTLECGTCPAGQSCGARGTANVCGQGSCTPTTCAKQGKNCGSISDGCGGTLPCGTCPTGQSCGAGGADNVCASICLLSHCSGETPACNPTTGACECNASSCGTGRACQGGACVDALGTHFEAASMDWSVPAGGSGESHGFWDVSGSPSGYSSWELDTQNWVTMDLNGDGKPDLVATSRAVSNPSGNGQVLQVYGYPSTPHWRVWLNTGTGFAAQPMDWPVPTGGSGESHGFWSVSGSPSGVTAWELDTQKWTTIDLNGDRKPDLVATSRAVANPSGNGQMLQVYGYPSAPHWRVWLNTGSGFAANPVDWPVPTGGSGESHGFWDLSGSPSGVSSWELGTQNWTTMDLSGDGKPDLVATSRAVANPSGNGQMLQVYGYGSTPRWLVWLNTGAGFAAQSVEWSVPTGGSGESHGLWSVSGSPSGYSSWELDSQKWTTMDLSGDGKPDLVATARAVTSPSGSGQILQVYGYPSAPTWRVWLSTGSGFAANPVNWPVPTGGSGESHGFWDVSGSPSGYSSWELDAQNWTTMDLNGDRKPDLVATSRAVASPNGSGQILQVYGYPSGPTWRVWLSTGSGFAAQPVDWPVPTGGSGESHGLWNVSGSPSGYSSWELDTQKWTTTDLDGDGKPDLVVTSRAVTNPSGGSGQILQVFGYPSPASWKVFRNVR